jgi:hypothetical protein
MNILGLLENQWFHDPARVRAILAEKKAQGVVPLMRYRERLVAVGLFGGCVTGRRIKNAFGHDLVHAMTWEESTPEIAGDPGQKFPPDSLHVREVIEFHGIEVAVAFGRSAQMAIQGLLPANRIIKAPHPANRSPETMEQLREAAQRLRDILQGGNFATEEK